MRSELLRPRAIAAHLLVLVVAGVLVSLGLWQLDRLGQIRAQNAVAEAQLAAPPVALRELADPTAPGPVDQDALAYRRVVVEGTYRPHEEVLRRGQQHREQAGFHVLTPLELTDGGVVLVLRGWVPSTLSEPPVAEALPPSGIVRVEGVLEPPVGQPSFGPRDPDEGELARVFQTDTARLDRQVEGALFPMLVRIDTDPDEVAFDVLPVPAGSPVLDERNHLSYAVQWFSFAVLAVGTYAAYLVTRRRRQHGGSAAAVDEHRPGAGGLHGGSEPLERVDVRGGA